MTGNDGERRRLPDLAGDVDDDAATQIVVGGGDTEIDVGAGADQAETRIVVGGDEAPTHIVIPAPARPRVGQPGSAPSRTATDVLDLAVPDEVATVPLVAEPTRPPAAAASSQTTERLRAAPAPRAGASAARPLGVAIALGALLVTAVLLFVLASDGATPDGRPVDAPAAGEPTRRLAAHPSRVLVGATPPTVSPEVGDLERRAIDLVAAHRYSEALPLYDDLVTAAPERLELSLARDLVRMRAEAGGDSP